MAASIASAATLVAAFAVAGPVGGTDPAPVAVTTQVVADVTTPAPTEQVIVDTVYVHAPAPTANPKPIVIPAPATAAPTLPPVKVIHVVVPSAGGEGETEHEGGQGGEGGGDD